MLYLFSSLHVNGSKATKADNSMPYSYIFKAHCLSPVVTTLIVIVV